MSKPERLDCLPESRGGMIGNAGTDRGNRFQFLLSFSNPLRHGHLACPFGVAQGQMVNRFEGHQNGLVEKKSGNLLGVRQIQGLSAGSHLFHDPLQSSLQDLLVIGNNGSNPLLDQGKIIDDGGGFCRKYIGVLEDQMLCSRGAELKNPVKDRFPLPKGEDFFPQFSLVLLGKKKGVPFTTSDNIQLLIQPGSLNFGEELCRLRFNGGSPDDQ